MICRIDYKVNATSSTKGGDATKTYLIECRSSRRGVCGAYIIRANKRLDRGNVFLDYFKHK